MRTLLLAITLFLTQLPSQPPAAGGGSLRGRLIEESTGRGLAEGEVVLQRAVAAGANRGGAPSAMLRTTSDENGRFAFSDVPPGQYNLIVLMEGFLGEGPPPTALTITVSAQRTVTVANSTAQQPEIVIPLFRGVVISGRVLDAEGLPAVRARIRATVMTLQNGLPIPRAMGDTDTDDRGDYRLFWLQPGEYFIQATPEQTVSGVRGGLATFYPAALTAAAGKSIVTKSGDVVAGIDIRMLSESAAPKSYKVSGRLLSTLTSPTNPNGAPVPVASGVSYYLQDLTDEIGQRNFPESDFSTGKFEGNVPAGSYVLYGRVANAGAQGTPQRGGAQAVAWGRVELVVSNRDIDNVTITVHPSVDVKGVLKLPDGVAIGNVRVGLEPDDTALRIVNYQATIERPVAPTPDGAFTIPRVAEADYRVRVTGLPPAFYISDVRQESVRVTDKAPPLVEVVMASDGGSIQGTVATDDGRVVASADITVVALGSSGQKNLIHKTATANAEGKFTIEGIRPGEYIVFASQNLSPRWFQNQEFMQRSQASGKSINVRPLSQNEMRLTPIRK
jgi:hypothetical protein